jgi:hypothetical protein
MDIKPGDYVIGQENKRNFLLQVSSVNDGVVYGYLDKNRAYAPQQGEFSLRQIVANLGGKPLPGNAYGCNIEPYLKTIVHPDWGNVHWFVRQSKQERLALKKSLDNVAALLKRRGLFGFVEAGALETEVRPPKGKYTGMYHFHVKNGENQDRMILRPREDALSMDYVVAHESGHGVWYRLLRPSQQARWIRLYHSYTKMLEFSPHDIRKLRDSYIENSVSVRDFRGQLEEAQVLLFDNLISSLCANTRLTTRHLDTLAENQGLDVIKDVWPQHVEDSDFEIAVTEYGTKNPEELWSEAFAYWLLGIKIPKRIHAAIEKIVANIRG